MRKLAIALVIAAGIVIVAALITPYFLDVNRYRTRIQAELEQRLNRPVRLGSMGLSLLPFRFRVQTLVIDEDRRFARGLPFAQAEEVDVAADLLPLLRGEIEIGSLRLRRPRIELIRNSRGEWNFDTLGESGAAAARRTEPPGQPKRGLSLGKVEIEDGQIALTGLEKRQRRAVYDHVDLTVRNYASGKPFSVLAAAHLPGKGAQEVRLRGDAGPLSAGGLISTPFQGTLKLKEVSISGLQRFLNSQALANIDGVLSGESSIDNKASNLDALGTLKVERVRVSGVDLSFPVTVEYSLNDNLVSDVIRIDRGNVMLGKTLLIVNGTVNTRPTPAQLDLRVKASEVSIAEAARLAAAFGAAFSPATTVSGRLTADLQALGASDRPTLNGSLSAHDVTITGKELAQAVQIKSIQLSLTPRQIQSNDFALTTGKAALAARFALAQYSTPSPVIDATLRAPNASLSEALSIAQACGVRALEGVTGSGSVALDLRATGPLKSVASADVARTLNGALALDLSNVRIPGSDIDYELASVGNFLSPGQQRRPFTRLSRVTGKADIRTGVAQTSNLQATLEHATVSVAGTASLVDQSLNLRLSAVVPKEFSQQMGGAGIGGLMNSALSNDRGELVLPLIVTGTFQHPRYVPDVERLAQMKLKHVIPGLNTGGRTVPGSLGKVLGTEGKSGQDPLGALRDLLQKAAGQDNKKPPTPKPH